MRFMAPMSVSLAMRMEGRLKMLWMTNVMCHTGRRHRRAKGDGGNEYYFGWAADIEKLQEIIDGIVLSD